jgi:hypothetical protein
VEYESSTKKLQNLLIPLSQEHDALYTKNSVLELKNEKFQKEQKILKAKKEELLATNEDLTIANKDLADEKSQLIATHENFQKSLMENLNEYLTKLKNKYGDDDIVKSFLLQWKIFAKKYKMYKNLFYDCNATSKELKLNLEALMDDSKNVSKEEILQSISAAIATWENDTSKSPMTQVNLQNDTKQITILHDYKIDTNKDITLNKTEVHKRKRKQKDFTYGPQKKSLF